MGRQASGVRELGLRQMIKLLEWYLYLKKIKMQDFCVLSENGYGKITQISDYKIQKEEDRC